MEGSSEDDIERYVDHYMHIHNYKIQSIIYVLSSSVIESIDPSIRRYINSAPAHQHSAES